MNWLYPNDIVENADMLVKGITTTALLAMYVMLTALILGLIVSVIRVYRVVFLTALLDGAVYLVRSIPAIMLIVLIHYGILPVFGIRDSFFFSAYVGLSLYTISYLSEIFRAGFASIHTEEAEAAISLGLTFRQRLLYVLIPLVFARMAPALINQTVTLIKDTSLASVIGVIELTRASEIIYERTLHEATLLGFVAFVYFVICYGLSKSAQKFIEARS